MFASKIHLRMARFRVLGRRLPLTVVLMGLSPACGGDEAIVPAADAPALVNGVPAAEFFLQSCAACHGAERQGGVGLPLLPERLTKDDDFYVDVLREGRPGTAMASWSVLGEDGMRAMVNELKRPQAKKQAEISAGPAGGAAQLVTAPGLVQVDDLAAGEARTFVWPLENHGTLEVLATSVKSDDIFSLDALPIHVPAGGRAELHFTFAPRPKQRNAATQRAGGSADVRLTRSDGQSELVRLDAEARIVTVAPGLWVRSALELRDMPTRLAARGDYVYVANMRGGIDVLRVDGNTLELIESIDTIARTPNHGRDGELEPQTEGRFIGGMDVGPDGTLYVTHTDPRMIDGGRADGAAADLNSGIVTALTGPPGDYGKPASRHDLITGLPRNQMNHFPLGTKLGPEGWLYVAVGAMTDSGQTDASKPNADTPISGAILRLKLGADPARYPIRLGSPGLDFAGADKIIPGLFEVWATGLRNGFGLAFDGEGYGYMTDQSSDGGGVPAPMEVGGPPGFGPNFNPDHLHRFKAGDFMGQVNVSRGERVLNDGSAYTTPVASPHYVPPVFVFGHHSSACGLAFYHGDVFPDLNDRLLVAKYGGGDAQAGGTGSLQALTFEGGQVTQVETLWTGAQITDVAVTGKGQIVLSDLYAKRLVLLDAPPGSDAPRPPEARVAQADGNEIYNGRFLEGGDGNPTSWIFVVGTDAGAGTLAVEQAAGGREARIDVERIPSGYVPHAVQLVQPNVVVQSGHRYRLSFTARSASPRPLMFQLGGTERRGWKAYVNGTIDLGPAPTVHTVTFTMEESTDVEARLDFNAAEALGSVWIGDVRLDDLASARKL